MEHPKDAITDLRTFRVKYLSNVIIGHLNIHSIKNKFELLSFLIGGKVDIFLIMETKIYGTFPTSQFLMSGYSNVYQLDRNDKGRGVMLFVYQKKNRDILRRITSQETEMVDILLLQSS